MLVRRIAIGIVFAVLGLASFVLLNIMSSSMDVFHFSAKLQSQFSNFEPDILQELEEKRAAVRDRAALYDYLLRSDHLVDGMVVNRNVYGQVTSICDSLLFSSLRYVALKKLGYQELADEAWQAIEKSQHQGHWMRHPRCGSKGTSRDMIVGVLAALTQRPKNHRYHLSNLLDYIDKNNGYIGHGPFHVSRLTPGIGELIRVMAKNEELATDELPANIRYGFSTLELDTFTRSRGYTSHLNAMVIWIELEMLQSYMAREARQSIRSVVNILHPLTDPLLPTSIKDQRLQWLTQRLARLDNENLFFRFLQYKAAGAMTPLTELKLLDQLLAMPQFPINRLPNTCDRKADYLWQRDSVEYQPRDHGDCHEVFAGVDFIWLAALLQQ